MQKVKDIAVDKRFDTQRTTDNISIIIVACHAKYKKVSCKIQKNGEKFYKE